MGTSGSGSHDPPARGTGQANFPDPPFAPAGLAEHRQFLLEQSTAAKVLFLDDDVWLEPGALERMNEALDRLAGQPEPPERPTGARARAMGSLPVCMGWRVHHVRA
jgi:hypothetical protein